MSFWATQEHSRLSWERCEVSEKRQPPYYKVIRQGSEATRQGANRGSSGRCQPWLLLPWDSCSQAWPQLEIVPATWLLAMEGGPDTLGLASQKVSDGDVGTSTEGAGFWG